VSAIYTRVIAFLALVAIWVFWRRGKAQDRAFLAVASLVYIAVMFATMWKSGTGKEGELIGWLLLETTGFLLVTLSKRIKGN
jgi:peptidoglycan/LPS O-acetylase OafA/YrhL